MYIIQVNVNENSDPPLVSVDPDKFHVRRDSIDYILFTMDDTSQQDWDLESIDFPAQAPITNMHVNKKTIMIRDDNRRVLHADKPLRENSWKYTAWVKNVANNQRFKVDPEVVNE